MKICNILFILCICIVGGFCFGACDNGVVDNITDNPQEVGIHFADNSDITLYLGLEGRDNATFSVVNSVQGYFVEYDHNIIRIDGNKIIAQGVGRTRFSISADGHSDSINIVVSTLTFCGDVSINDSYVFDINGASRGIDIAGLDADYGYGITYSTNSDNFAVNAQGVITPLCCGSGELTISLVGGVDDGSLQYVTLITTISVVDTPSMSLSVLDADNNVVPCVDNYCVVHTLSAGTTYKLRVEYGGDISNAQLVDTADDVEWGERVISNNVLTQSFVVNKKCSFDIQYAVPYSTYNLTKTITSSAITIQSFVYITNIDIHISNTINGEAILFANNTLDLYILKAGLTARADALQDGVCQDADILFEVDSNTDGLFVVEVQDSAGAVTQNNGVYSVRPTTECNIVMTVTAVNGGYQTTLTIHVLVLPVTSVEFADLPGTIAIGDVYNIAPVILPSYALANIVYDYDSNAFVVDNGVLTALSVDSTTLSVSVGAFVHNYNITIIDDNIGIYTSTSDLLNGFDGLCIGYNVGDGVNFAQYEQAITLYLYDQNENALIVDNTHVAVNSQNHSVEIYVDDTISYFKAVLYSSQYDVYAQPIIWTRS